MLGAVAAGEWVGGGVRVWAGGEGGRGGSGSAISVYAEPRQHGAPDRHEEVGSRHPNRAELPRRSIHSEIKPSVRVGNPMPP